MKLINTIEISPSDYASKEYSFPGGNSVEFPEEWNTYWLTSISDSGLGNLKAIRKGSYLVEMSVIGDKELEEILRRVLKEVDMDEIEYQIGCLCGGIVVKEQDKFLIEPTCCSDIGNIKNWEQILKNESSDWTNLWIGHPWVYYRNHDGIIEISEYTELNKEQLEKLKPAHKFSEIELKAELQKAMKQQQDFRLRIYQVLENMQIAQAERIAALMTGE